MSKERKKIKKIDKPETLAERIKKVSEGLFYISESDAEILPFVGERGEAVNAETILKQTNSDAPVEERDFKDFFKRLTELQEWFGDEEIENANKFAKLRDMLQKNLRDIKVFKVGRIEIDIYVVGLDAQNILTGIQTKAVET
jgi:hypothetical protein